MEASLGLHGAFFLYAFVMACSIPVIYLVVPETLGLSLEEIQSYFDKGKSIFTANRIGKDKQKLTDA